MGTGVKAAGAGVDHSLPSSTQVKNARSSTSNRTTCLHGVEIYLYLNLSQHQAQTPPQTD